MLEDGSDECSFENFTLCVKYIHVVIIAYSKLIPVATSLYKLRLCGEVFYSVCTLEMFT